MSEQDTQSLKRSVFISYSRDEPDRTICPDLPIQGSPTDEQSEQKLLQTFFGGMNYGC